MRGDVGGSGEFPPPPEVGGHLPGMVESELEKLECFSVRSKMRVRAFFASVLLPLPATHEGMLIVFLEERKEKSGVGANLLSLLFSHYLDRSWVTAIMWITRVVTAGIAGLIWWRIFRIPGLIREYNKTLAIMGDMQATRAA